MTEQVEPDDGAEPAAGLRFPTLQKSSVGSQAVEAIKSMIVAGQLRPGQALPPERELAAMLGISRPSLREATKALGSMNVLEVRHGGGTFVSSLDPRILTEPISFLLQVDHESLEYLFEVRKVIEVGAARLAAPRITDAELSALDELVDAAHRSIDDPNEYLRLDFEIHAAVVAAVKNPIYTALYESIAQFSLESRRRTVTVPTTRSRAHKDHKAIVRALHQRDSVTAANVMQAHIEAIERAFSRADGA